MNKQKFLSKFISAAIMTVGANTAFSGTVTAPDAGQILNEIERNEKFLFPDADGLQNIKPNVEPEAKDEPRVELKSFPFLVIKNSVRKKSMIF